MEEKPSPRAYTRAVQERIDLAVIEETKTRAGNGPAIAVSIVLHILFIGWIVANYHPVSQSDAPPPIARYVELIRQNPETKQFTEAPGKKLDRPVRSPQFSDANREAATPHPTGDKPTMMPGEAHTYTPQAGERGNGKPKSQPQQAVSAPQQAQQTQQAQPQTDSTPTAPMTELTQPVHQANAVAHGPVDWRSAIKSVKVASLGTGDQGPDLGNPNGGEKGFAREGPLSFETTWFDWGDYAQGMVSRIRVNWYNVMPDLLRTGMQGVVTIRFTIHHDGQISDVTILKSSGVPPYDFAAKKAIESSSPLAPLPKDFPKESERVTCMFYYNMEIPNH